MIKDFFIADNQLNAISYSTEQALLKQITQWKGWKCSAGVENIHVTADGNVYGATCKVGGLLANIYDNSNNLPSEWVDCDKVLCACGSDMRLRKAKDHDSIKLFETLNTKKIVYVEDIKSHQIVGPFYDDPCKLNCTWDLGRRCNFSCDYCNSSISNNYEAHRSSGSLNHAYNEIKRIFCKNNLAKFVFTGGEPTLNPNFLDLVKKISHDGHTIHTQTNGSQTSQYYSNLIQFSFIGISVHLKFYDKKKLIQTIQTIQDVKSKNSDLQFQWFGVRIMAPPNQVKEATQLYEELKTSFDFKSEGNNLILSPVYEKNFENQLQKYELDEIELMQNYL